MSEIYKSIVIHDTHVFRSTFKSLPEAIEHIRERMTNCTDSSLGSKEFDCVVHGPDVTFSFEALYPLLMLE